MYNGQILQDLFVDILLKKENGFFVDIGAGTGGMNDQPPGFLSNTFFLEKHRGWNGICIDNDTVFMERAKEERECILSCEDLMKKNINDILSDNNCPNIIDYISFDVDSSEYPNSIQEKVMEEFDFQKYKFRVMTFEHNLFQSMDTSNQTHTQAYKEEVVRFYNKSRDFFASLGYEILCGNVSLPGFGFVEDWYIMPSLLEGLDYQYLKSEKESIRNLLHRMREHNAPKT